MFTLFKKKFKNMIARKVGSFTTGNTPWKDLNNDFRFISCFITRVSLCVWFGAKSVNVDYSGHLRTLSLGGAPNLSRGPQSSRFQTWSENSARHITYLLMIMLDATASVPCPNQYFYVSKSLDEHKAKNP